jgi:hypothetical protein
MSVIWTPSSPGRRMERRSGPKALEAFLNRWAPALRSVLDGHGHLSLALRHFDEILDGLCAAA